MQVQPAGSWTPELSSVDGATPTTMTSPAPTQYLMGTLDGISQMLSLPTDSVRGALKQGSSISDLAQQQGVSRTSIAQYVTDRVQQQRNAKGLSPLDPTALDQTVNRALDRHRRNGARLAPSTSPTSPQSTPAPLGGVEPGTVNLFA